MAKSVVNENVETEAKENEKKNKKSRKKKIEIEIEEYKEPIIGSWVKKINESTKLGYLECSNCGYCTARYYEDCPKCGSKNRI